MNSDKAFIIGVAGGTASGKTTLSLRIINNMQGEIVHFSFDQFYFNIEGDIEPKDYNFDHPKALDFDYAFESLHDLWNKKPTKIPVYSFITNKREKDKFTVIQPKDIVIVEGILIYHDPRIRKLIDLKIFIHCDSDIALCRRLLRDIAERGRDHNEVLWRYNKFVRVSFEDFVKPTMKFADIILPGGANNDIGMKVILDNLKNLRNDKKVHNREDLLLLSLLEEQRNLAQLPKSNLYIEFNEQDQTNLLLKGLFHKFNLIYLNQCFEYWFNIARERSIKLIIEDFGHGWDELRNHFLFSGIEKATLPLDKKKGGFSYKGHLLYSGLYFQEDLKFDMKDLSAFTKKHINHPKYLICVFTDSDSLHLWLDSSPLFKILPIFVVDSKKDLFEVLEKHNLSEQNIGTLISTILEKQLRTKKI